jgi:hypothetical protein
MFVDSEQKRDSVWLVWVWFGFGMPWLFMGMLEKHML